MQTNTTDYAITDYGIGHAEYFQGHGVAYTEYEHAALGIGDTYSEALNDALENAAQQGYDVDLQAEDRPENWEGKGPSVHDSCTSDDEDMNGDCMLTYYVGLRWK